MFLLSVSKLVCFATSAFLFCFHHFLKHIRFFMETAKFGSEFFPVTNLNLLILNDNLFQKVEEDWAETSEVSDDNRDDIAFVR